MNLQCIFVLLSWTLSCHFKVMATAVHDENLSQVTTTQLKRRLGSVLPSKPAVRSYNRILAENDILPPVDLQDSVITPVLKPLDPYTFRISAGSTEDYIDADGKLWKSDTTFTNTGDIYSVCPLEIINTTLDALYCKERYFNKWVHINKAFKYDIPVPRLGSAYTVKLHFAEINYKSAKERVFDVWVNGKLTIRALDVYNEVGYATALVIPITTRITGTTVPQITIEFVSRIENPKICAIEVIEQLDYMSPPTAAPVVPVYSKHISAGATENWFDADTGITWEKDQYFGNKGAVHSICPAQINGTELDSVYCKDRYFNKWEFSGPYRYEIPVPKNDTYYSVKLHFAEFYYQTARARMFDVLVNGKLIVKNLDLYHEAGYLTAYVLPVVTLVRNGTISIELVSKIENPKICAIEIMELPDYMPAPTSAPAIPYALRISAGATEDWIDSNGIEWEKDKYYNKKGNVHWVCPRSINGTELDDLYCKDRYFSKWEFSGPFRYDIPVPKNTAYSVKLHFAEVHFTKIGERVFDVLVNGRMAFKNLDIYMEVGYSTAFVLPIVTMSTNTSISIEFISKKENPKICAIEVNEIPNYVPPPTMAPVPPSKLPFSTRISAGATEDWIDEDGIVWGKDKFFDGKGEVFTNCPFEIADTDLDSLYCKERFFNRWKYKAPFRYEIPVPRVSAYSVKLHFAEVSYQTRGERIFDVLVDGKVIIGALDIFAEVGYAKAYILPTITQSSTGFITIQFVPKVEHPKICAIEIIEIPDYIAPPTAAPVVRPFEILINSGAVEDFTERGTGRVWMKDNYFIGGGVLFKRHFDIKDTLNDEVFHIERHGQFRYEIPVPPGRYELILHFTELHFSGVGKRLFDIRVEDFISFKNIDLIKMSGLIRRAFSINYTLPVTDGLLSLDFTNSIPAVDMPKISGVEVRFISTSTDAINPFPILINCGGGEYVEVNGTKPRTWISDRNFINGVVLDNSKDPKTAAITNKMYHSVRVGALRYEIPVPIGRYDVTLHFAEIFLTGIGTRLFDIVIEDAVTYRNVDLVKLGNGTSFRPVMILSKVNVTDGLLTIVLTLTSPAKNNPIISGIEINLIQQGLPVVMAPTSSPMRAPVFMPIHVPTIATAPVATIRRNCTIPRITPDAWTTPLSPYPITVAEPAGDLLGKDFVIFSGFKNGYVNATTETYALDMSMPNVTWKRMDNMPFAQGITHQGLVVIGMKAYLCGGYIGGSLGVSTNRCFVYDHSKPAGQQWSNFTSLPKGGRSGGAMIYDSTLNAIIYAGGSQRLIQGQPVAIDYKDTWMYSFNNPVAGWVQQSNIPFYGNHMNSITVRDSVGKERHYVFGGQVGDYELWGNIATMYEYIAATDKWIQRASMPFARGHSTSAVRAVGCGFLVAGGRTNKGLTGDISYYNSVDDTWQSIGRLPVDIHTNVCVIAYGKLRCETGWATGTFSTEVPIQL